jgi:hypothetical protein
LHVHKKDRAVPSALRRAIGPEWELDVDKDAFCVRYDIALCVSDVMRGIGKGLNQVPDVCITLVVFARSDATVDLQVIGKWSAELRLGSNRTCTGCAR